MILKKLRIRKLKLSNNLIYLFMINYKVFEKTALHLFF